MSRDLKHLKIIRDKIISSDGVSVSFNYLKTGTSCDSSDNKIMPCGFIEDSIGMNYKAIKQTAISTLNLLIDEALQETREMCDKIEKEIS